MPGITKTGLNISAMWNGVLAYCMQWNEGGEREKERDRFTEKKTKRKNEWKIIGDRSGRPLYKRENWKPVLVRSGKSHGLDFFLFVLTILYHDWRVIQRPRRYQANGGYLDGDDGDRTLKDKCNIPHLQCNGTLTPFFFYHLRPNTANLPKQG